MKCAAMCCVLLVAWSGNPEEAYNTGQQFYGLYCTGDWMSELLMIHCFKNFDIGKYMLTHLFVVPAGVPAKRVPRGWNIFLKVPEGTKWG